METTSQAALDFERSRSNKTFTDKHGASLAQRLYHWTGATVDADLPEIHVLLAKAPKGCEHSIITVCALEHVQASAVPLTAASALVSSVSLLQNVFQNYQPHGTGFVFRQRLTPFAMVCEGHQETEDVRCLTARATLAEFGSSVTFHDAATLTTTDVWFPTTPQAAAGKLYAWSIMIDLFHGTGTDIAHGVQSMVMGVGLTLHRIYSQMADSPGMGMDLVCRVLFEAQQVYFSWVGEVGTGGLGASTVPTFTRLKEACKTYRVQSLSTLPNTWYTVLDVPNTNCRPAHDTVPTAHQMTGVTPTENAHADRCLMACFASSGHSSISTMTQGHDVTISKHAGREVCLIWALKGQCASNCRRAIQHVHYFHDTIAELHSLLGLCGVANNQASLSRWDDEPADTFSHLKCRQSFPPRLFGSCTWESVAGWYQCLLGEVPLSWNYKAGLLAS